MATTSVAVLAATTTVLLTGSLQILSIRIQSATPGLFTFYDLSTTTLTRNLPAYSKRTITHGVSTTVTDDADCCTGPVNTFEVVGTTDVTATQAARPTFAVSPILVLPDGCCEHEDLFVTTSGLVVVGSVAGTVVVEYRQNIVS